VLMSTDTTDWQPVPGGRDFGGDAEPFAAASGDPGYVVVGTRDGTTAAAWSSTDLKNWRRADNAGKGDLDGSTDAPKWMSDVTAGPAGFVAVGGQTKNKSPQPALWTSPDGKRWTLSPTPPSVPGGETSGSLTSVTARGSVLVAAGTAGSSAFAAVSADAGRTWQPVTLPGAVRGTAPTAVTVTPRGFVLVGTAGSDAIVWTSADGRTWRVTRPHGFGLNGPGVQRLDGVTALNGSLLAVGFNADYQKEEPTLWRRPVP
jgi:hypothetical protein